MPKQLPVVGKQQPPKKEQRPVPQQQPQQQQLPNKSLQPQPQQPLKTIPIHPKKLHFVATKLMAGFERQLVGKTLEVARPVLLYTMDTKLTFDRPIKEFQFSGYQIFRYFQFLFELICICRQGLVFLQPRLLNLE